MNNSGWNSNSNRRLGQDVPQRPSRNSGDEAYDAATEGEDYSDRRGLSSDVPKIKIFGQQVYKTDRIDDRGRQELHNQYGRDPLLLIFNSHSCSRLKECIGWGYQTRQNHVEQGGILLGYVKQYQREIFSFVDDCVLANTRGSSAFVEFTPDMWSSMQQELDNLNAQRSKDEQIAIIGWFHTHPNGLSTFMSGTDQDTQDKNFSQDWQVSVVLNPQKMKMRAFFGKEIRDGRIAGWDDKPLKRPKERDAAMSLPEPETTGDLAIDAEIARCEEKINEYNQRIIEFKKNARKLALIGVLLVAMFFAIGLCVGNFLNRSSMPVVTSEPPTNQAAEITAPVSKNASVVMFSIVSEKWISSNGSLYCDVVVGGKTTEGTPYNSTQRIKCNSDESFIELEAGTYSITISNLPSLTGDFGFKDVVPIYFTVDGTNPKLITIDLETKELTTSEPASGTVNNGSQLSATTNQLESSPGSTPGIPESDAD